MSTFSTPPAANPAGSSYTCDDIKLRRDQQPQQIWAGAFSEAWELVKAKPLETLILSFVWLMFNGGGGSGGMNFPTGGGGGGGGGGGNGTDQWNSAAHTAGSMFDTMGDMVGRISAGEIAIIGFVIALLLTLVVVGLVLGTLVRGGATIFWLRHVRGQDATLGHSGRVIKFFVPLLLASLLSGLGMAFGFLLCIVPGVVLMIGWSFTNQVIVDKNLGWYEALRASWRLTEGYKLDLFLFGILCMLLNFVGVLACCVGVVVTNAVVMGASVIVYNRIAEPGNAYLDEPGPAPGDAIGGGSDW